MTQDLPEIISDDEFDALLKQREQFDRPEHDRWDNAGIRAPQKPTDGLPESSVEQKFPRIAQKLTLVWRSEACALFIKDLVVNSDRDSRQGFPVEIIEDLMMLYEINETLMPKTGLASAPPAKSPWPNLGSR